MIYKVFDLSFDNEHVWSDPIRFPPDRTFSRGLKFEFERGVFICFFLFYFQTQLFSNVLKLHLYHSCLLPREQIPSGRKKKKKRKIQNLQGTYVVFSLLPYLSPPGPGPCRWTESHSWAPHPPSLCKQITWIRENKISIFFRLYLHCCSRAGALMKFKDEWRPR